MQLLRLGAQAALAASGKRKSGSAIMGAFVLGWGKGHWQPEHPQKHLLCYHHRSPVTSASAIRESLGLAFWALSACRVTWNVQRGGHLVPTSGRSKQNMSR